MTRFVLAALSLLFAVVSGVQWLGQPFRPVHLVKIIGLGMLTGVLWMQAVTSVRAATKQGNDGPAAWSLHAADRARSSAKRCFCGRCVFPPARR